MIFLKKTLLVQLITSFGVLARRVGLGLLQLRSFFHLLLLSNFGKHDLAEDGASSGPAKASLLRGLRRSEFRVKGLLRGRRRRGDGFGGRFVRMSRDVRLARHILFFVFLHLERLNPIRQLDDLHAATQSRFGHVGPDLRQQVVVRGGLAADPDVLQCLLCRRHVSQGDFRHALEIRNEPHSSPDPQDEAVAARR